ncbi:AAA family ATPase [Candidatus Woesearchaeota archaeon]|nr:AAA family ATPase [Candidatus Woesearchaeota archaeon]
MSEYNLLWRRYGLKENPFFVDPLTISGDVPLSLFVGRISERNELGNIIRTGEARCLVVGYPGVGKTSLVNFVRSEAAKSAFFTPIREIEINRKMPGNEFIILTISAIYDTIKSNGISLPRELAQKLDALYELTRYGELTPEIANLSYLNRQKLTDLFKELINKIVYPRFKGVILHYDNLDNIENPEDLLELISDIRDFILTKKIVYIFVGDSFLPSTIFQKTRVSSVFLTPAIEINKFSYEETIKILEQRLDYMRISETSRVIPPYSEGAIKKLYDLYEGNLRDILTSLTTCVKETAQSNSPILMTDESVQDILYEKVRKNILSKLSTEERKIVQIMLNWGGHMTPTELSKQSKKIIQSISSTYLPKLIEVGAVRFKQAEGRNRFYEVTPVMKWAKLQRSERQKMESKEKMRQEVTKIINRSLSEFL